MGKFAADAEQLLKLVGGKENINAVTHCVTRMRFVLADPSKADVKAIEALPSAKGSFTQAGQFQVIIGNEVAEFYDEFTKVSGIEGVSKDAAKQAAKTNQNPPAAGHVQPGRDLCPADPRPDRRRPDSGFRSFIGDVNLFEDGHPLAGGHLPVLGRHV